MLSTIVEILLYYLTVSARAYIDISTIVEILLYYLTTGRFYAPLFIYNSRNSFILLNVIDFLHNRTDLQ